MTRQPTIGPLARVLGPTVEGVIGAFPEFAPFTLLPRSGQKVVVRGTRDSIPIVLKVPLRPIPESGDEETDEALAIADERVRREISALKGVGSPRVTSIIEGPNSREIEGRTYIWYSEPFYPHILRDVVSPPWPTRPLAQLMDGLLDGIQALQAVGIVHRDIKPENIALTKDRSPVLLDFGVSLFRDLERVTEPGSVAAFTRPYSAPEQWTAREDDDSIDVRTDLFCLGLVAYELATGGSRPFGSWDTPERWRAYTKRVTSHDYDRDSLRRCGVAAPIVAFIDRCIRPAPSARFRTAEQARSALEVCL